MKERARYTYIPGWGLQTVKRVDACDQREAEESCCACGAACCFSRWSKRGISRGCVVLRGEGCDLFLRDL